MSFFNHIKNLIRFMQLQKSQKTVTFYSEGKNYWPHLEELVIEILEQSDISVCYFSSDKSDPGLKLDYPNLHVFKIDEGFIRNWLFENIDTQVMVMTMPDLDLFQVKRSKFPVHYVYIQHSLVSLHMAYRKGAFDSYDTIFCAGPHHVREMQAIQKSHGLPEKQLVQYGYSRLSNIIEQAKNMPSIEKSPEVKPHILMAPSWGPNGIIESGLAKTLVRQILTCGCKVTLRPHPQTIKFATNELSEIVKEHSQNKSFILEHGVDGQQSLHDSDYMVSDWSGAALEYAFGLGKPVLFVDVPKKVNNPEYETLNIEPFESQVRTKIGSILTDNNFSLNQLDLTTISIDKSNLIYKNSPELFVNTVLKILAEARS